MEPGKKEPSVHLHKTVHRKVHHRINYCKNFSIFLQPFHAAMSTYWTLTIAVFHILKANFCPLCGFSVHNISFHIPANVNEDILFFSCFSVLFLSTLTLDAHCFPLAALRDLTGFDWLQFSFEGLIGPGTTLGVPPEVLLELTFPLVIFITIM